ncbi:MAG: HAMP domain-containing histidine kinase [Clostridia bacterium]|nr:HAMP domain-containing histidine kinase [Clostridia bacterium]
MTYEAEESIEYESTTRRAYEYLIIDNAGIAHTNIAKTVHTDTIEELKDYIKAKKYFWNYDNNQVDTNVEKMKFEDIAYSGYFGKIEKIGYTVYSCANEESTEFYKYNLVYKLVSNTYEYASVNIAIGSFLLLAMFIYIITSIGHKKEEAGIYLNSLDNIPLEIVGTISSLLLVIEGMFLFMGIDIGLKYTSISSRMIDTIISLCFVLGIIIYITLAITGVTIIRRIKAKVFWKNTLIYKFAKWVKRSTGDMLTDINTTGKLVVIFGAFYIIQLVLTIKFITDGAIYLFWLIAVWGVTLKMLLDRMNKTKKIREKIKNMYDGNKDSVALNEEEYRGELKEVAHWLNDISGGLTNAIEEAMKSERLKTELITNVSHDIKTPLTSIINYVDLMKQENIENEKVKEYLEILDNKSQRLKKLTEDLVEASKASSGNIKLNIEKLNVKELIKQVRGEFEDKFEQKGLEIIENLPDTEVYIEADSRYMFRVMENMYVNISKYALENSRVYVDVKKENDIVKIELKNISRDKLNISVDELMQRFVRGDSARTTEGSGLGISIANSLTKLQKGKFDIYLDGDLFKVVIEFKVIGGDVYEKNR